MRVFEAVRGVGVESAASESVAVPQRLLILCVPADNAAAAAEAGSGAARPH